MKMDGWKTTFLSGPDLFSVAFAVSFGEGISLLCYCFLQLLFVLREVRGGWQFPICWMMIVRWLVITVGGLSCQINMCEVFSSWKGPNAGAWWWFL